MYKYSLYLQAVRTMAMAEIQNDPLLPGYSFNAHLVAGLTPIEACLLYTSDAADDLTTV